jgi:hypothetical protein
MYLNKLPAQRKTPMLSELPPFLLHAMYPTKLTPKEQFNEWYYSIHLQYSSQVTVQKVVFHTSCSQSQQNNILAKFNRQQKSILRPKKKSD